MKKIKALGILFSALAIGAVLIPVGGATFFYGQKSVNTSHNAYVNYDPVRENHIFNDEYDQVYSGQKFYDVYFAAQIAIEPGTTDEVIASSNLTNVSEFKPDNPTYGGYEIPAFGYFPNDNDSNQNTYLENNPIYYKSITNVTSITTSDFLEIGNPQVNLWDKHDYRLNFIGWSLTPTSCYANYYRTREEGVIRPAEYETVPWPTRGQRTFPIPQSGKGAHASGDDAGKEYYVLPGYYPYSNDFVPFRQNLLLSNYDEYVQNIDGDAVANDLVLYPIYSSGKNYYYSDRRDSDIDLSNELKDSITFSQNGSSRQMLFSGILSNVITEGMPSKGTESDNGEEYMVYRVNSVKLENSDTLVIEDDIDSSDASWSGNDDGKVKIERTPQFNGYYNIYLVTFNLDSACDDGTKYLTNNDLSTLNNLFQSQNIHPYSLEICSEKWNKRIWYHALGVHSDYDYRSFAIVYERLYEPRLIAGPTGGMDYEGSSLEYEKENYFVQTGNNVFRIMNVPLDGTVENRYTSDDVSAIADSTWFAIQAASDQKFTYNMNIVDDSLLSNLPTIQVNQQTEYFYSQSLLEKYQQGQDYGEHNPTLTNISNFPLVHIKNPGNYDIEIHLNLENFADNTSEPAGIASIDIYVHRRVVHFINILFATYEDIYAEENQNTYFRGEDESSILQNYLKTDNYQYRCDQFVENELLTGETEFYSYNNRGDIHTFEDLLTKLENGELTADRQGYYLADIVTGRIFTKETIQSNPFSVDRSCVLILVPKQSI